MVESAQLWLKRTEAENDPSLRYSMLWFAIR